MTTSSDKQIVLFTSKWCPQSRSVEKLLDRNGIPVSRIIIDGNSAAREELIKINDGFASVPTLILPDGTKLVEPSFTELSRHLNLEPPSGLVARVRGILSQNNGKD